MMSSSSAGSSASSTASSSATAASLRSYNMDVLKNEPHPVLHPHHQYAGTLPAIYISGTGVEVEASEVRGYTILIDMLHLGGDGDGSQ